LYENLEEQVFFCISAYT